MEFKVGDKVVLNVRGRREYGPSYTGELVKGVTVTDLGQTATGPFVKWSPDCGGCYNHYLQLAEGPW